MNKLPDTIDTKFLAEKLNEFLRMPFFDLAIIANDHNQDTFSVLLASGLMKSKERGEIMTLNTAVKMLLENMAELNTVKASLSRPIKKTFEQFCEASGYARPYEKQIEMKDFVIHGSGVRMILGSRGYGKTDYAELLGYAYKLYCDWYDGIVDDTCILITKSEAKNAQLMREFARILEANGVPMEVENAGEIRIAGLVGKDSSLVAIPMGSASFRGRHPKRIIFDDPVTPEDTSETVRARAKIIYNEAFKLCDNIVIVGQPAHKFDLYEELRTQIQCLEVPHGTIPELDHDLDAQRLGGVDEDSIQASYHLKVTAENSSPFATVKFIPDFPKKASAGYLDPSFEGGDYSALTIITPYFSGVAVVGFVWKKAWHHCADDIMKKLKEYKVSKFCIETNSLGDMPVELFRKKSQTFLPGLGVMGRKTVENKHAKIMNAGTFSDSIHISKKSDKLYIDHVTKYEYKSKFDDAPDSLASCLEWVGLVKPKHKAK